MTLIDVLIPTYNRKTGLTVVLTSLLGQTFTNFNVIISDQTPDEFVYLDSIEVPTILAYPLLSKTVSITRPNCLKKWSMNFVFTQHNLYWTIPRGRLIVSVPVL